MGNYNIWGRNVEISGKTVSDYEKINKMPLDDDAVKVYVAIVEEQLPDISDAELSEEIEKIIKTDFHKVRFIPANRKPHA